MNASPASILLGAVPPGPVGPESDTGSCVAGEFTIALAAAAGPQAVSIAMGTELAPEDIATTPPDGMQSAAALAFLASLLDLTPSPAPSEPAAGVADAVTDEGITEALSGSSLVLPAAVKPTAVGAGQETGPETVVGNASNRASDLPAAPQAERAGADVREKGDSSPRTGDFSTTLRSAFGGSEVGARSAMDLTSSLSQVVASAVHGATSAPGAAAADVAADVQATVRHGVGTRGWAEEVGSRLVLMSLRGQQEGSLKLTPEHMGPMEVRISVGQERTDVWFGAQHADTRAALNEAMPRLREMFAASGLALGHTGVSQDMPRQEARTFAGSRSGGAAFAAAPAADLPESGVARRVVSGLLDAWA